MAIIEGKIENVVEVLNKGIEEELKKRIRETLTNHAMKIVEEVADKMSRDLVGHLVSYKEPMSGNINLKLFIDKKDSGQYKQKISIEKV